MTGVKSQADRIRAAWERERKRDPDITRADLARKLKLPHGTVRSALIATRPRGRPPLETVRVTIMLRRELADQARAIAERDGYGLADWLIGCVLAGVQDEQAQEQIRDAVAVARAGAAEAEA